MASPGLIFEWDETKRAQNLRRHKLDFSAAYDFDWDSAVYLIDDREEYGELRELAIGFIGVRLHTLVFTRRGTTIRIISLRRSENKEKAIYVEAAR